MKRKIEFFEIFLSMLSFTGALLANYYAGRYVKAIGAKAPSLHNDLLLSWLPRLNLSELFIWGFAAFIIFAMMASILTQPERIPYVMWMYALLISLRAFFVLLTPMGVPPGIFEINNSALFQKVRNHLTFGNDLFFSAHTAMPFLGFLIYRRRHIRFVFLALSVILAGCVLIARFHYSIDVAAAYFITFALVRLHQEKIEPHYRNLIRRIQ
ncbi:MAG: hypothetical protein HY547_01005 [Elusimicrobia bacterium]|nr:hypothetical protein [Elusimicrobiota bacterium]